MSVVIGVLLQGLTALPAEAGAWNEPAGHGLVIVDYTLSGGSKYFDGAGKLSPAAAYSKQEAIGYLEYGVTDTLMAIVKPSVVRIAAAASPDPSASTHHYVGLGTSEAGLQLHVLTLGPAVFAVQGTVRVPGTTSQHNAAQIGNTSREGDLRALAGYGFVIGATPAFLDLEAGYRFRSGGASGEWHMDATIGARVQPRWFILIQSFTVLSDGVGTAWFPASSYSKLGGAAVYDLGAHWSIEVGGFQTMLGSGALRERGVKTALWYRF